MTAKRRLTLATFAGLLLACGGVFGEDEPAPAPDHSPDHSPGRITDPPPVVEIPTPEPLETPPGPDAPSQTTALVTAEGRRPSWAPDGLCEVPQIANKDEAFREAGGSSPGALTDGLLLCDVTMSETPPKGRKWDLFGNPPDPSVQLTIDGERQGQACASDTMNAILSWPNISISPNGKLKLSAQDVDMRRHDFAGVDVQIYEGQFPVDLRADHFRASCRALTPEQVAPRLTASIDRARQSVAGLKRTLTPEPLEDDWGFDEASANQTQRSISMVAGYTGWTDGRVGGILKQYDAVIAGWETETRASVARYIHQAKSSKIIDGVLQFEIVGVQCEEGCQVRLRVTNTSNDLAVLEVSTIGIDSFVVSAVMPSGWDAPLQLSPLEDVEVFPGRSEDLILVAAGDEPPFGGAGADHVQLIRVRSPRGTHTLLRIPR